MKKLMAIILSVVLTGLLMIPVSAQSVMPGDIDGNSKITAADARAALRFAASVDTPTEEQITVADVDANGKITAADARLILRAAAKIEDLPSGGNDDESVPDMIKALTDGKYYIESVDNYEDSEIYTTVIAMDGDKIYYESSAKIDEDEFSGGYILDGDTVYEWMKPENIAAVIDEEIYSEWYDAQFVMIFKEIFNEQIDGYKSTEIINGTEHEVFTYSVSYGTLKFYFIDGAPVRMTQYDAEYNQLLNLPITEYTTDYDSASFTDPYQFEVMTYDEFIDILYGTTDDYYDEEFWEHDINWDEVPAVNITDPEDYPPEYEMLTYDTYHMSVLTRTVVTEENMYFEPGDYLFSEFDIYKADNKLMSIDSEDILGLAQLFTIEKNEDGEDELVLYFIDRINATYALFDDVLSESFGLSIEDFGITDMNEFNLITGTPDSVTVQEYTDEEGIVHRKITVEYTEDNYVSEFYFENGDLVRNDDYVNGEDAGKMIVYTYSDDDFDPDSISLYGLEKVGSMEFFAILTESLLSE